MKSIKEKQILVKWAKAMNEPIDPALVEEVERYNQLQQEIKESIRSNTINDLFDASKVAVDIITKVNIEYPKPPTLEELLSIVQEESNELVQAQATEASPAAEEAPTSDTPRTETVKEEAPSDLISRAVDHIHKEVKSEEASFQQPQPTSVEKNFNDVQKKLKFLEQAIGKIAATGPGGGAVNIKDLDDVNYATVVNATDGQALVFNAGNAKWEATTLAGGGVEVDTLATVTNRGNVTTNGITVRNANANFFAVNTTAGYSVTTGQIAWNASDLTFDMGMANGVVLQVGQEQHIKVKAGAPITNGQAVMFGGANGEHIIAVPNDASVPGYITEWFIGIATHDIPLNGFGYITTFGKVHDVNTLAYAEGDILYANPSVVGGLTKVPPTPPLPNIVVAAVTKRAGGDGHILVRPSWRGFLTQLNDVSINGATAGQVLSFQNNVWYSRNVTTANVVELTNLYFTNARVYSNVTQLGYITSSSLSGYATNAQLASYATTTNAALKANIVDLTTANVTELTNLYFTNARTYTNVISIGYATNSNVALKANIADLRTANVAELTNLYFTNARAIAAVVNTSLSNLTVGGGNVFVTYQPATAVGAGITVNAANTQGGTGYADFLKATNISGGATNPNKTFRLSSAGAVEIINSAYSATLMSLSDTGAMSTALPYQVAGKQAVNGPAFSAYAEATLQTIPNGVQTKVLFQTEEFDTNSNYASSRFTPTVAGYYQLNAEVRLDGASGTGEMMIILYKNGAEYKRGTNQSGTQIASNFWAMQVSSLVYANGTGDYFEIYVQQGSGGTVSVTAVNNSAITWFNGCMLRGA